MLITFSINNIDDLGKIFLQIRLSKNLLQKTVASDLDISQSYLSQIENGSRLISLELLQKIINYYKIHTINININI